MPTAWCPTRAAAPRRSCRSPKATSEQAVAEAKGQSARFLKVYDEYKKAPDVTRQRIYLETMERILGGTEKLIYDGGGRPRQSIVPYLPLSELTPRRPPQPQRPAAAAAGGTR
jgi:membrane protease subunit HflK